MRRYETMVIVDPDLSGEKRDPLLERMEETISQQGGVLISVDDWGTRKLAYEIKKKVRGHYLRLDYCGNGELVNELERLYRIDDRVMKYMTVLLEKEADVEAIKAEMAKAEAPQEPEEPKEPKEPKESDEPKESNAPEKSEEESDAATPSSPEPTTEPADAEPPVSARAAAETPESAEEK